MNSKKDWASWHEKYDIQSSDLNERLRLVQNEIHETLPKRPQATFRILDICAGDGRDLLPVLKNYEHSNYIEAHMVEIDRNLGEKAQADAQAVGLEQVTVLIGDAADTDLYKHVIPADLILVCGVFGNISNADIEKIISVIPEFCKQGTTVIWTRNRREADITPWIRELFSAAGFSETNFVAPEQNTYAIGVNTYTGKQLAYKGARTLFTFTR